MHIPNLINRWVECPDGTFIQLIGVGVDSNQEVVILHKTIKGRIDFIHCSNLEKLLEEGRLLEYFTALRPGQEVIIHKSLFQTQPDIVESSVKVKILDITAAPKHELIVHTEEYGPTRPLVGHLA
jgi:hypothetical protein